VDVRERVAALLEQLTLTEKIGLLHQYQAPVERLGLGAFRTGTEALHGLAWLGEATVFPQAVGLGATWDPDLVRRVGAAVGDEVRVCHDKDPTRAGLNVWAPVVNPLRDPRWGRNEEGYSEDAWLTGLFGQSYAEGLRGDHPVFLKTAPTLKHFLGYNNETDRCTTSSNLSPRVLHEYELAAFRPAIESGAAVAVMASYNFVNGRPAHVTPHINDDLRRWTEDDVFVVSDAYAPSNLADQSQQAFFADHAESHAAALKAGVDSFTDQDDRAHVTIERVTQALERGLLTEADIDTAVKRALTVRVRLGEFDPNPYTNVEVDLSKHQALAREAAQRSVVLLKRECGVLPLKPAQRVAVIGPLGDQLMADWYSGTMPYQVTVRSGLSDRLGPQNVSFHEGVDRIALSRADGTPWTEFDVFDWGGGVVALRTPDGGYLSVRDGRLICDSPGPNGWEVQERFRFIDRPDGALALKHEQSGSYVAYDGLAEEPEFFHRELRRDGAAEAASVAAQADAAVVVLGNHPLINGRETEDRADLSLPEAQERLLRKVYAANPRTVLVLSSSYPYSVTWADANVSAILWSSHGGQEYGHAMADVLFGEAEPAGRLPQTWYRSHAELPDLFDYDIITSDATYLYYRGTPLYPFGHGLSYTEFEYRDMRLSGDNLTEGGRLVIEVDVANVGVRAGEEVVQLYTHQQRSRVKQPLRRLRGFQRVSLEPGECKTVELTLAFEDLAFWDVTSGRMVVESANHKVMAGRCATDIRLCRTLGVRGQRIGPRMAGRRGGSVGAINVIDGDESSGVEPAPLSPVRGDGVVSTEPGAWVSFGATDLSAWRQGRVMVAGGAGRLTLRADDPLDGEVLAAFDCPGGPRYEQREVTAPLSNPLSNPGLTDLYLVWDSPGIVAGTLSFQ